MIREYKELAKKWNALNDDFERLHFCKENKDKVIVMLDNDSAHIDFKFPEELEEEEQESISMLELKSFDDYFGWSDGVQNLFFFTGIDSESV